MGDGWGRKLNKEHIKKENDGLLHRAGNLKGEAGRSRALFAAWLDCKFQGDSVSHVLANKIDQTPIQENFVRACVCA